MLVMTLALNAALASGGVPCAEESPPDEGHLMSVCSAYLEGERAYSATFRASLSPLPAAQQVMVYHTADGWFMRIAGYRWEGGSEVSTRRNDIAITDADAEAVARQMAMPYLEELAGRPYYGSRDVICTDGADYELAMSSTGRTIAARQHSCAGKTELNRTAAMFRKLALKYDARFEGLLSGLKD